VGCGKIAGAKDYPRQTGPVATHAQAYTRHPAFQIEAVTSLTPNEIESFQRVWSIHHGYRSVEDMLERENLDVVSICSPSDSHFINAFKILSSASRPRILFIEKPVCLKPAELAILMDLAQETEVVVWVNHSRRFDPAHREVAQLIRSGSLGPFHRGRCIYYGGWIHNGVHTVDTLLMMLDKHPELTSAAESAPGKADDPCLDVRMTLGNAELFLEAFNETLYQLFEIELLFQLGRIRFLDFGNQIHIEQVRVNEIGERELKPMGNSPLVGMDFCLYYAVEAMDLSLRGEDVVPNLGVDLYTVSRTMSLIWNAIGTASRNQPVMND
jgi:predicted dehydrogenase